MPFFRKNNKNNHPQHPAANDDVPPAGGKPDNNKNPNKKPSGEKSSGKKPLGKKPLKQKFNDAMRGLRGLSLRDVGGTAVHTVRDLRQPKEIGILIVAIIVPGGMFGWSAYRLQKFKTKDAANGNSLPAPKDTPDLPPPANDAPNGAPADNADKAAQDKNKPDDNKPRGKNRGPQGRR
ncbi:MAG TPA: hypothetical protein DIW20_09410 [Rhodospirillaceae bacterium]|nr:hypothetical protein [Rhodospirillaceae bacterium]